LEVFAILHGFRNVFIEEIRELPLMREIYFFINLLPGYAPVSKEPYGMSVLKLTENLVIGTVR